MMRQVLRFAEFDVKTTMGIHIMRRGCSAGCNSCMSSGAAQPDREGG